MNIEDIEKEKENISAVKNRKSEKLLINYFQHCK